MVPALPFWSRCSSSILGHDTPGMHRDTAGQFGQLSQPRPEIPINFEISDGQRVKVGGKSHLHMLFGSLRADTDPVWVVLDRGPIGAQAICPGKDGLVVESGVAGGIQNRVVREAGGGSSPVRISRHACSWMRTATTAEVLSAEEAVTVAWGWLHCEGLPAGFHARRLTDRELSLGRRGS
ncbi:hypothetical protein PU630_07245 [Microbacterium horticulturae]|uniref:Uncharacterized protein n=1 Tax=Microbacterium horticulturae TaxID=3028316 RepID=A0ABY8C5H9_9MICO|nr:hypothetical protein [Microbacterium sp. KACC 23027]WEG10336.1 hypothetical protein PU630_07245 [Microbacterium sp. KACC 23027]